MKDKASVVEFLKTTPIVQVACQKAGISRATYYRWREEDEKFKEESDKTLKEGTFFVNDIAESQLISLIKDKHPTSIYYWLNNHHPSYSEKRMLLSPQDQKLLIETITSQKQQKANQFVAERIIQGKIPRSIANALISIIMKTTGDEPSSALKVRNELDKLVQVINSLSGPNND